MKEFTITKENNFLVKYHNTMNEVYFKNFSTRELNLFFIICSIMKNTQDEIVKIHYQDLKNILDREFANNKVFEKVLKSVYDKLLALNISFENEKQYMKFVLFSSYKINYEEKTIEIKVNELFIPILNDLANNFTIFEIKEFTTLKSVYSKHLYRILKQYKKTGRVYLTLEEFRNVLVIPSSYEWRNINQKVINPILKELSPIFKNLTIEKKRLGNKGNKITHLYITFDVETVKTEMIEEAGIYCPECNEPLYYVKSEQGTILAHKNYPFSNCRQTFSNIEEVEKEIAYRKKKAEKPIVEIEATETCPYCNHPLELIEGVSGSFYGHRHYKSIGCKATFSSKKELEMVRTMLHYPKEENTKKEEIKNLIEEVKKYCNEHKDKIEFMTTHGNKVLVKNGIANTGFFSEATEEEYSLFELDEKIIEKLQKFIEK